MKIHTDEELIYEVLDSANGEYFKHIKSIPEQMKNLQLELESLTKDKTKDTTEKESAIHSKTIYLADMTISIQNRIKDLEQLLSFVATTHDFEFFEVGYTFTDSEFDVVNNLQLYPIVTIKDPKAAVVFRDIFGQDLVQVNTEFRVPLEAIASNSEFLIDNKLLTFEKFLAVKRNAIQQRKESFWYRTSETEKMPLEDCLALAAKELEVVNSLTREEYMNLVSSLYSDLIRVLNILK